MKTTLLDTSYLLKYGIDDIYQSFGTVATTESVHDEIIRYDAGAAHELKILSLNEGPSLKNFIKVSSNLYIWNSSSTNLGLQLIKDNQRFEAICSKHTVDYHLSIIGKDLLWEMCQYVVERPDFSLVTATIINPAVELRSEDRCLGKTIAKIKTYLEDNFG